MNRRLLLSLLVPLLLASCGATPGQDSIKPTVSLETVPQGANLLAKVTATDNVGIKEVRFYVGNQLVESDQTAPYESTLQLQPGVHTVKVIAIDTSGNESASEGQMITVTGTDVEPPNLELSGPREVRGVTPVKFTVNATDNVGITRVIFYDGDKEIAELTSAPYVLTRSFTTADNGPHSYRAVAYDAAGNSAESTLPVNVNISTDTVRPVLTLDVPEQAITTPGEYTLRFSATDNVGVTRLEGQLISRTAGGNSTLPLSFNQPSGSVPLTVTREMNGSYILDITAYDAAGNSAHQQATIFVNIP